MELPPRPPKPQPPPLPREATIFACAVQRTVDNNESKLAGHLQMTTPFHVSVKPTFDVDQFVRHIHLHAPPSEPAAYVVAYAYLCRFLERKANKGERFPVTFFNFERLVLLSIMIAAKYLSQSAYKNACYGMAGGMSTKEVNRLELLFLTTLKYDLHVDSEAYDTYYAYLERVHSAMKLRKLREAAGLRTCVTAKQLQGHLKTWHPLRS